MKAHRRTAATTTWRCKFPASGAGSSACSNFTAHARTQLSSGSQLQVPVIRSVWRTSPSGAGLLCCAAASTKVRARLMALYLVLLRTMGRQNTSRASARIGPVQLATIAATATKRSARCAVSKQQSLPATSSAAQASKSESCWHARPTSRRSRAVTPVWLLAAGRHAPWLARPLDCQRAEPQVASYLLQSNATCRGLTPLPEIAQAPNTTYALESSWQSSKHAQHAPLTSCKGQKSQLGAEAYGYVALNFGSRSSPNSCSHASTGLLCSHPMVWQTFSTSTAVRPIAWQACAL